MSIENTPTPDALGFRPVARFGIRSQLTVFGRKRVEGEDGQRICYLVNDDAASQALFNADKAVTYMWIETGADQPFYVGKASFGMKQRTSEHEGGFHGTAKERRERDERLATGNTRDVTPGFGHARRIRKLWDHDEGRRELELWVRPADYVEVFGSPVSLAAAEEERLIAMFQPPWNREHKRED